ncbi:hypothetical protein Emag_006265 [Eimeria magna]
MQGTSWELTARRRRPPGGRQARPRAGESSAAGLWWRESGARRRPHPGGVVPRLRRPAAAPVKPGVRERGCKSLRPSAALAWLRIMVRVACLRELHLEARDLGSGAASDECDHLMQVVVGLAGSHVLNEDGNRVLIRRARAKVRLEARVKLLHVDVKGVSGAVQSLDRQLHGLPERAQRSKMPRRHCVRSAGAGECSTATRRRGESSRKAGGGSTETPRSGLDRAGEEERRRVTGSAAVFNRARRARVRAGSPAASLVAETVETERLRLGRGGGSFYNAALPWRLSMRGPCGEWRPLLGVGQSTK